MTAIESRRELAAALVRSGRSVADVAAQLGCCIKTVYNACHRLGALPMPRAQKPVAVFVRSVHDSMDAREWEGICLWHRACADACREVATWRAARWHEGESEAMACDAHREAMQCRVRVRARQVAS